MLWAKGNAYQATNFNDFFESTVTNISQYAFSSAGTIYYNGTKKEFAQLMNEIIIRGTVICTDGEIQISSD